MHIRQISLASVGFIISIFLIFSGFTISASRVAPISFGPPVAHASKSFVKAALMAVVIIAVAYVAAEMIVADTLASADVVTNAVVENAVVDGTSIGTTNIFGVGVGETGGYTAIFGTVPTATFAGAVAVNQAAILFVECVTGLICGSDGGGESGVYNVAAGTVSGGDCYGPANSCGQAYKGTYEQDPATGQMGCKISDSFTYGKPGEDKCIGPSVDYFRIKGGGAGIDAGQSAVLEWNAPGANYCKWHGADKDYKVDATGLYDTGPLTKSSTYQINCADASGNYGPAAFATVPVFVPDVSISADHPRVKKGDTVIVTWSGKDIQSCVVSDLAGTVLASGTGDKHQFSEGSPYSATVTTQSVFKIMCKTNGDPITKSVIVNVVPNYGEF